MKTAKIGLVVLSALHLCYSVGIGDVIVQEENFLGTYDEDSSVLDLSHLDVDKLISETDDEELYDIFHLVTKVTVSDISFKSLKKLCQYNIFIDVASQDNVLDCVDVKRESRLVKRENDDSEDDSGSGDSDINVQEEETPPADPVSVLESNDGSGDSEIVIQETTIAPEEQVDNSSATDAIKEYEIAQASVNEGETAKEADFVDSVPNGEESKNEDASETQPEVAPINDSQPEVAPIDVSQPDSLPSETVNQPTEESVSVDLNVSTEAPSEVISETSQAPEATETVASSGDETVTAISEESIVTTTNAEENTTPIPVNEETLPKESETPIPLDQDVVPDEIKKTADENIPSILSRGSDLIPIPIPVVPEETTTVTEQPAPKADSPRKLGDVDSADGASKSDSNEPPQPNPIAGGTTDSKQKENLQAGTVRKEADQTDQDQQTPAKSGISGLNVFIFFVIAAAVAGAAVFGYKMYKNRQVSYSTVNTGEDFGKELQEVKVKRTDDDRNADGQKNFKEVKPLMFNDLDITEIEEQEPHTPQPTPRTFKVIPTDLDQNSGEGGGDSNTKKNDQQ